MILQSRGAVKNGEPWLYIAPDLYLAGVLALKQNRLARNANPSSALHRNPEHQFRNSPDSREAQQANEPHARIVLAIGTLLMLRSVFKKSSENMHKQEKWDWRKPVCGGA